MNLLLKRLWQDEQGFVVSTELVLLATIVVIGLLVGMVAYRDALFQELGDTGAAIGQMNQSYTMEISPRLDKGIAVDNGVVIIDRDYGCILSRSTSRNYGYIDNSDVCSGPDAPGQAPTGTDFGPPSQEGQ